MGRQKVAAAVHNQLMVASQRTCCICHEGGQQVQLHHIDGDASNSTVENLAVLCLRCHGRVEGDEGHGRRFTSEEVREHKRNWEETVEARRTVGLRRAKPVGWWRQVKANFYTSSHTPVAEAELCDGCGHDVQFRPLHRLTADIGNGTAVTEQFCSPCFRERGRVVPELPAGDWDDTTNPTRTEYVRRTWLQSSRLGTAVTHRLSEQGHGVDHVGWGLSNGLLTPIVFMPDGTQFEADSVFLDQLPARLLADREFVEIFVSNVRSHLQERG